MEQRLVEFEQEDNWTKKIFPMDEEYFNSAKDTVYIEVFVSDVEETIQLSKDCITEKTQSVFKVYRATQKTVEQLSAIPNEYFRVSLFSPRICMRVEKEVLQQIANQPQVYCIRVIPPLKPLLTLNEMRTYDDMLYTMYPTNAGPLEAATKIAVIDSGYDTADSWLYGEANDRIMPNYSWSFISGTTDVSGGWNFHGTTVADWMVRGFGDTGGSDWMYEDPHFWVPLQVHMDNLGNEINPEYVENAIEWCIAHDIEIVCMSNGIEPGPIGMNTCDGVWCDLFRTGTLQGMTWVAAAGNEARTNGVCYPAESHFVIAVGAYDNIPAQKESYSDYGTTYYGGFVWPGVWLIYCPLCFAYGGTSEFKPNAYECGHLTGQSWEGTSFAAPIACADIAIGMYDANNGDYIEGYESLVT